MPSKTILITGSNGFIGSSLVQFLLRNSAYNVVGISFGEIRINNSHNLQYYNVDIENHKQVNNVVGLIQPDVIVHCAAISQVDLCEENPQKCHSVNVDATKNLVELASQVGAKFIFLSSDFVFDGAKSFCDEDSIANPISVYGQSKLDAEKIVKANVDNYAIVRPILVYGYSASAGRGNIFTWVLDNLTSNTEIKVVNDQIRTPTFVGDVVQLITDLISSPNVGIFHIGGETQVSVYEFAKQIAQIENLQTSTLVTVSSSSIEGAHLRPRYSCFQSRKIRKELNLYPMSTLNGIELAVEQFQ